MAKDLHTAFKKRKMKKTNKPLAWIVCRILRIIARHRNTTFEYDEGFRSLKGKQMIVLCQHRSNPDFVYVFGGLDRTDMHVLVGYQNIFQRGIYFLLKHLGVIAKMLYQPDVQAVMQIMESIRLGESVVIFPEGIQSTSGSAHPINPATMSLLRKCKLPVALVKVQGSYFTKPRYARKLRKGAITVRFSKLFDTADFETYGKEELYQRLLEQFRYDEFEEHKQHKVAFVGKEPNITGLDNIIYKCPHCMGEHCLTVSGERMTCGICGFAVSMDEYYDIHPVSTELPFENIDQWYKWQRRLVAKEVQNPDFCMTARVELRKINTEKLGKNYSLMRLGEGELILRSEGATYRGMRDGEQVELFFDAKGVFSMTFSLAYDLDIYYQSQYFNFKFLEREKQVVKWMLCAEEIHNLYDAAWREASVQVYDYET